GRVATGLPLVIAAAMPTSESLVWRGLAGRSALFSCWLSRSPRGCCGICHSRFALTPKGQMGANPHGRAYSAGFFKNGTSVAFEQMTGNPPCVHRKERNHEKDLA